MDGGGRGVGRAAAAGRPELGEWAGLLGEGGAVPEELLDRLSAVLEGRKGEYAQAVAVAALQRLFQWWWRAGEVDELLPAWAESVGQPGLLRLVAAPWAPTKTRQAAFEASRTYERVPDQGKAGGLLLQRQQERLAELVVRSALLPGCPLIRDLFCYTDSFVARHKEKHLELMPAIIGFVGRLRRQAQRGLGAREALGPEWGLRGGGFPSERRPSSDEELCGRWKRAGGLLCTADSATFRHGHLSRLLAMDGAAVEMAAWLLEFGFGMSRGSFFRSGLADVVEEAGAGDAGLTRLLAAGAAEAVVRPLLTALRGLLPAGPDGRAADLAERTIYYGVCRFYESWALLGPLAGTLEPAAVGGATALLRARLYQGHGLDDALPYLRRIAVRAWDGEDAHLDDDTEDDSDSDSDAEPAVQPLLVPAEDAGFVPAEAYLVSTNVRARMRLLLSRYAAALRQGPALSHLPGRIDH